MKRNIVFTLALVLGLAVVGVAHAQSPSSGFTGTTTVVAPMATTTATSNMSTNASSTTVTGTSMTASTTNASSTTMSSGAMMSTTSARVNGTGTSTGTFVKGTSTSMTSVNGAGSVSAMNTVTPNLPNTGNGGESTMTYTILIGSALIAFAGIVALARKFAL